MKHTKYFSGMIKSHGIPHLSVDAFAKMMNVVYLEGAMESLRKIRIEEKEGDLKHKYFFKEMQLQEKLDDLTLHREPAEFYKYLHKT